MQKDLVFYKNIEKKLNNKINLFQNNINQELKNLKQLQDLFLF
ncbi:MAG: hypothetical protein Q8869_02805 [Candidatus Phytoplasma australasiaticum]|nr:hypothetical protein [Candidatus Phytoplasma australasiaticum]